MNQHGSRIIDINFGRTTVIALFVIVMFQHAVKACPFVVTSRVVHRIFVHRTHINIMLYGDLIVTWWYLSQNGFAFIHGLRKRACTSYMDNINCDNCYTKENGRTIKYSHRTHCIYYYAGCKCLICCILLHELLEYWKTNIMYQYTYYFEVKLIFEMLTVRGQLH